MTTTTANNITTRREYALSLGARGNIANWCGIRGGGTAKFVACYCCGGRQIPRSSFAAKYPQTKQSYAAVEAHWQECHEADFKAVGR